MNKKKKYTYTAMIMVVLVVIAVIIVNVIVGVLSQKIDLSLDMTKDNILEFSEDTERAVGDLEDEIEIISLVPVNDSNVEMRQLDEILRKYDRMSDKISYIREDAQKNPGILRTYKDEGRPLENSYYVIVRKASSDEIYTVVDIDDLFSYDGRRLTGLMAEQFFTSAILKTSKGNDIKVCISVGHDEPRKAEIFKKGVLPGSVYEFQDVNLMSEDLPEDTDVVVIASPQSDYTVDEINKIDAFVDKGGSLQVFLDVETDNFGNLYSYLDEWGIEPGDGVVCEGDSSKYTENSPLTIIGEVVPNTINDRIYHGDANIIFPNAKPVSAKSKYDMTAQTMARTSKDGYIKKNSAYGALFAPGDEKTPSDIAVMVERPTDTGKSSMVFVCGTSLFLQRESNHTYYSNLISYMSDTTEGVMYIAPKDISQNKVTITQERIYIYAFLICLGLPVIIVVLGFIIWIRRRHL